MKITLYTTHCPKCHVLEQKLKLKGIEFETNENVRDMTELGLTSAPALMVGNTLLHFSEAIDWVNKYEVAE